MGRLKIYDPALSREAILKERAGNYLALSAEAKFMSLLNLIRASVKMNGGKPLKYPQGKGIIIKRK